jgi:hypothetical protein
VQLFYKSRGSRSKDEVDFRACLPLLGADATQSLRERIALFHPDGHPWLAML